MATYTIQEISNSVDRNKLFILLCDKCGLPESISYIQNHNINAIDVGREVASYIDGLPNFKYLIYDVYEFILKLLDSGKSKINGSGNDIVAIYNLGILLEPELGLNALQIFKEFSKSDVLIIIWENQSDFPDKLNWSTQKNTYSLDFSDTQLKKLQYEI